VFTILPPFVWRSRQMPPEVARDALWATHGGLSVELCAVLYHISPMALYRLVCAFGHEGLVTVLTRCGLPLLVYFLADEKPAAVSLPRSLFPRSSGAASSGISARPRRPVPRLLPSPMGRFNAPHSSTSHPLESAGCSPMAATARPKVGGRSAQERASASAYATRASSCRRHSWPSPPRSARRDAPSATRCSSERASARACACLPWASGGGAWRTLSRTPLGRPRATGDASGCRPRKPAGMRCSPTRRCL